MSSNAQSAGIERPLLVDLFCGDGGAGEGYRQAGYDVVGVDIEHHNYPPGTFIQNDAIAFLRSLNGNAVWEGREIAAIHASPPCQSFTAYRRKNPSKIGANYPNLIPDVRELIGDIGVPYVIENVGGSPLNNPVQLCGSSFGLDVRRHRYFESNMSLEGLACDHSWQSPRFAPASNRTNLRSTVEIGVWRIPLDIQRKAMGIDWMNLKDLSESIPPAYTAYIGRQLLALRRIEH